MLLNVVQGAADYPTPGTERRYNVYTGSNVPTGASARHTLDRLVTCRLKFGLKPLQ